MEPCSKLSWLVPLCAKVPLLSMSPLKQTTIFLGVKLTPTLESSC